MKEGRKGTYPTLDSMILLTISTTTSTHCSVVSEGTSQFRGHEIHGRLCSANVTYVWFSPLGDRNHEAPQKTPITIRPTSRLQPFAMMRTVHTTAIPSGQFSFVREGSSRGRIQYKAVFKQAVENKLISERW
jgi:hypothetical protein